MGDADARALARRPRAARRRTASRSTTSARSLTYARARRARATRLAAGLAERGLRRGDRVATLTANSPDHVATSSSPARRLGLILQPLSWRLAPAELAYQLDDAEPALLLVEAEHEELARGAARGRRDPARRPGARGPSGDARGVAEDDDPLLLVYTSGTTGKPKGALLTHANCFWTNLSSTSRPGSRGDDVVLQVLPQFHCGGWNVQPLLAWWKGATVVLERSFDPAACARADRGEAA